MNDEEFENVVLEQHEQSLSVLCAKAKEYSKDGDRFHNFKIAGRKRGVQPHDALDGMRIKHVVSIEDMWDNIDTHKALPTGEMIDEKFGDVINYYLLEKGMMLETCRAALVHTLTTSRYGGGHDQSNA